MLGNVVSIIVDDDNNANDDGVWRHYNQPKNVIAKFCHKPVENH